YREIEDAQLAKSVPAVDQLIAARGQVILDVNTLHGRNHIFPCHLELLVAAELAARALANRIERGVVKQLNREMQLRDGRLLGVSEFGDASPARRGVGQEVPREFLRSFGIEKATLFVELRAAAVDTIQVELAATHAHGLARHLAAHDVMREELAE